MSVILSGGGLSGSINSGSMIVNDYRLVLEQTETGGRLTISRGNDVQTLEFVNADISKVLFRAADDHIQITSDGGVSWTNVIPLEFLRGPQGEKGDTGATGPQGPQGEQGVPGEDAPAESVLFIEQNLNDSQQAVARSNISAASQEEVDGKQDAISIVSFGDAEALQLEKDVVYHATADITALTISLPNTVDADFRCAIDFGCGDTAAALVYPDAIVWSGDSLDSTMKFVPTHNKRYHIDVWYDGAYIRANASGVIA